MQARLFHLHALSALHCGVGQSEGVVDLPIARARASRLPIMPGSSLRGLLREVVTTHHSEYYGSEGAKPATDFDSPVPNAQVAAQGSFLFVVEGPGIWLDLAEKMLVSALVARGAGAKTRSGYGLFAEPGEDPAPAPAPSPGSEWVDARIAEISKKNNAPRDQTLRGRLLAQEWSTITDPELKQSALAEIQARWSQQGWWDRPPGRAARQARGIYEAYLTEKGATP